jgi:glycosyltransferase involved in cell wall biosynthesis
MAHEIHLSVVIPVYNEEGSIPELSRRLSQVCRDLGRGYEILFVDDGSCDKTLEAVRQARSDDRNISALMLSRNSGKSQAYSAGFDAARGQVIITMDGDLQDRPEQIPDFLKKIEEGYDLVTGWKHTGKGKRTWSSRLFNRLVRAWTGLDIHDTNCPFKAYRREVVKNLKVYGTLYRFIPALAYWKGYRVAEIKVENDPRKYGTTKYGPGRALGGFFDLLTVAFLTKYIKRPLHFFGLAGLVLGSAGFIIDLAIVVNGLISGRVGHQAMLLLGLVLIIIGVQFVFTGLLAEMMFRLFQEQGREVPVYRRLDG